MESAEKRLPGILKILEKTYPAAETCLTFRTPWELLVATVLSAQCTDERVNKVTPGLFAKFPDVQAFAGTDQASLEAEIRSTGFFRNKSKNLLGAARKLMAEFGGRVPATMAELVTLPGVARKTANIVLSSAFQKAEGIAVDVHVARITQRLGLTKQSVPEKIERDLLNLVPKKYWLTFNHMLVLHGRALCQARKPRCGECPLSAHCPKIGVAADGRKAKRP
jgi:endonuclease III